MSDQSVIVWDLETVPDLKAAARSLSIVSVLDFNVGVDRANISPHHWIYFPENEFIFSRVGFPANFSSTVAPAGTSSIYIEITYSPRTPPDPEAAYARAIADLRRCGVLRCWRSY